MNFQCSACNQVLARDMERTARRHAWEEKRLAGRRAKAAETRARRAALLDMYESDESYLSDNKAR